MDQTGSMKELFKACGYPYETLEQGESVNVFDAGIEVLSWNFEKNETEYKRVLSLVRKQDIDEWWRVREPFEGLHPYKFSIQGTKHHKVWDPYKNTWVPLPEVTSLLYYDGTVYDVVGKDSLTTYAVSLEKIEYVDAVLDIEVADNACYFTGGFLSHNTTSGGEALKFYSSQRVDVRRIGGIKDGTDFVANRTRVKVVKNKLAVPFKECEFNIRYGHGIDIQDDILALAVEANIVQKSGSWYSKGEQKLGQGSAKVCELLREDSEMADTIRKELEEFNDA
jgi:hypothetical protein